MNSGVLTEGKNQNYGYSHIAGGILEIFLHKERIQQNKKKFVQ